MELANTTPAGRPAELLRAISTDTYREAYDRGRNLSVHLEELDPSTDHPDTTLDAFGRLCRAAGVRVDSVPEMGLGASTYGDVEKHENARYLIPELLARMWRGAATGRDPSTRSLYLSTDSPSGQLTNPWAYSQSPRFRQIQPAIPLSELVAFNTGINADTYKAFYLTYDAESVRMKRVAEATSVPRAHLIGGEHTIRLGKYGRSLEISYESLRRMPIDLIAFHIARIAVQSEADKVTAVMDVMINGDGNAGTSATVYNLTTLDPAAVAGTLTLKAWLAFEMLFVNPYIWTTGLARNDVALQARLLNTGSANVPKEFLTQFGIGPKIRNINQTADGINLGWTADAPALKLVGFDIRFAIERVYEIGATITEVERITNRQVEVITMTETEGYDVFDQVATKILDVNA